jgi:hypothetical protein
MSLPLLVMLVYCSGKGKFTGIGRSRGAAEHDDGPQGVAVMAASAFVFLDDDQGSCTSLSGVIWDLHYQGSGAYDGPAARELPGATPPAWLCRLQGGRHGRR